MEGSCILIKEHHYTKKNSVEIWYYDDNNPNVEYKNQSDVPTDNIKKTDARLNRKV